MLKPLLILLGLMFAASPAYAQDNQVSLEENPAVVLPVFYVVKLDVEGYKIEIPATTRPAPQVVYSRPVDRNYINNSISPQILLQKLSDNIDAQLESKP